MNHLLKNQLKTSWQRRILKNNPQCSNALEIELIAFRYGTELGRFHHMQNLANFFFSKESNPEITKPLIWNKWTIDICRLLCDGHSSLSFRGYPDVIGITGPGSSSKTYSVSLYVFLLWYSNPLRTKGVVSSTSIQAAKNRIWADVLFFANSMPSELRYYDVLTSNPAMIRLPGKTNRESIELIAGDDSQSEASDKVLGIKNDWFILAVDEATEVSHALFHAMDNVSKNPRCQSIFIGNAKSHDDPHGLVCEPAKGWDSITIEDEIWETKLPRGVCIHLDGLKSPNMVVGDDVDPPFPGLFSRKHLYSGGEIDSPGYVRFTRGFWAKSGSVNQIYTIQDIELNDAKKTAVWLDKPTTIIGHDVAFSSDGDQSKAVIIEIGQTPDRIPILNHVATENVDVDDSKTQRRSYAMAERLKEIARKYGVSTENIGVDCTGTGVSYPEIVDEILGGHCMRIPFNGTVSELPYPSDGLTKPQEMFDRRVSELWYIGKLFLQKGQFRGFKQSLISDMCKRLYDRGKQNKICVETKRKMRERGIKSPDEADAFMIALAVARERFSFEVYKGSAKNEIQRGVNWLFEKPRKSFREWAQEHQPKAKMLIARPEGGWMKTMVKR